ncbi:MAG: NAD+ synthase [Pseudanabaenaceae cyanobacterium]
MLHIAIAQLNPIVGDLAGNSQLISQAVQWAQSQGADLLITPELSLCGYPPRDLLLDQHFLDSLQHHLHQLAEKHPQLPMLVGTATPNPDVATTGGKPIFNSTALLKDGQVAQVFHKRLLPTYDVFDEDRYFAPSTQSHYLTLKGVRIGVTICEDIWNENQFGGKVHYAANPVAELVAKGIDLLVNVSASPFAIGKPQLRQQMLAYTAKTYQLPLLYVNQVGGNDDLIFDGGSMAYDRHGNLVANLPSFTPAQAIWQFAPHTKDFSVKTTNILPLPSPTAQVFSALVLGVQDYVRKCGFHKVVIGLSGGIDSALVATIATFALGQEQVLGVLMPSPYSSEHSVADALALARNLGIHTEIIPIAPIMTAFDQSLQKLFQGRAADVTEENIQSRIRGTLLMAISNKLGHLLLSTGNKSELAVGYCTLYGDMNGGLAVIGDVPKTLVYRLCHWINQEHGNPIPQHILEKAPSAELRPQQKDQDSLPPYEIVDDILEQRITHHRSPQQIIASGHDSHTVHQVLKLLKIAEFKRRQAPPVLKISDRAFGSGWRMPIASKYPF